MLIDGGASDGVEDGMIFKIIGKKIDLNSKDTPVADQIDPIELYKAKLMVKSAFESTSLCQSTRKSNILSMRDSLMNTSPALNVDNNELEGSLPDLTEEERVIHVGDEVVHY